MNAHTRDIRIKYSTYGIWPVRVKKLDVGKISDSNIREGNVVWWLVYFTSSLHTCILYHTLIPEIGYCACFDWIFHLPNDPRGENLRPLIPSNIQSQGDPAFGQPCLSLLVYGVPFLPLNYPYFPCLPSRRNEAALGWFTAKIPEVEAFAFAFILTRGSMPTILASWLVLHAVLGSNSIILLVFSSERLMRFMSTNHIII